ncbi:TIGR04222 domain-containing membrane protein [Streptomyces sp. NPDC057136]|uniref:TIGR04222 domain-containing membrane protein n=1 Tax=Streptomyces sp. NPDC057136 TaxID=3346029 RepID=UPI0036277D70
MNALAILLTLAVAVSSALLIARTVAAGRSVTGADSPVHDLYEAAFLNGGPARVVDTALTAMYTDGRLTIGGPGIVAVLRNEAHDPVERAVLQELAAAPSGALNTLREAVMRHPAVQETGDGLAARGLLVSPGTNRPRRTWALVQGLGCIAALPVGLALTFFQYTLHEGYADIPFPFIVKVLPALLAGAVIGMVVASSARSRITKAGRRAADGYRAAHAYVMTPAHLVATLGLRALPDPELQAQLVAAARARTYGPHRPSASTTSSDHSAALLVPAVWCAGAGPGSASCGSSGGGGGGGCGSGSGGSTCSSGCGGSSGGGGGSSCGSSSGSSCGGSSSSSSCSSSSGGSSCSSSSS